MVQDPGVMNTIINQASKESGLSKEKIGDITSLMVTYLNTGAKYGDNPEGFFKWYIQDMGGNLDDKPTNNSK